jgi:hypothetical protein
LLGPGKAGAFELGRSVDEIYQLIGRDHVQLVDLFLEGMFAPALQIRLPEYKTEPSIIAEIREWPCPQFSIWRMSKPPASVQKNTYLSDRPALLLFTWGKRLLPVDPPEETKIQRVPIQ